MLWGVVKHTHTYMYIHTYIQMGTKEIYIYIYVFIYHIYHIYIYISPACLIFKYNAIIITATSRQRVAEIEEVRALISSKDGHVRP